jgi:hypothetical protein
VDANYLFDDLFYRELHSHQATKDVPMVGRLSAVHGDEPKRSSGGRFQENRKRDPLLMLSPEIDILDS